MAKFENKIKTTMDKKIMKPLTGEQCLRFLQCFDS